MVAAAVGIGTAVAGVAGASMTSDATQSAADTQAQATQSGIAQQNYEFNTVQGLLKPYVQAGTGALSGYGAAQGNYSNALGQYSGALEQLNNMTGVNGADRQQGWINSLTQSPLYTTSMNLGQQAILANASATGGLRGGNTISSLGYLPGQIMSNVMGQQISNQEASLNGISALLNGYGNQLSQYGNLMNLGENAAAGTGQAAQNTGNNITSLMGINANAQSGATLAGANATTGALNSITGALGKYLNSGAGASSNGLSALMGINSFAAPAYLNAAGIGNNSYGFTMPS